jgi:hypothetical protein
LKEVKRLIRKLPLTLFASVLILTMILVGTAHAIYVQTTPIDSQLGTVWCYGPPYYVYVNSANCTSWYEVEILPHNTYQWEWITISAPMECVGMGDVIIGFESYITIQSVTMTLTAGTGNTTIVGGGPGYSWVDIHINGTLITAWQPNLKTNYIPSSYWGSDTDITIEALTGGYSNATTVSLGI